MVHMIIIYNSFCYAEWGYSVKRVSFILFLILDFAILVALFLFSAYYGVCHLFLLIIGLILLLMCAYDLKTGIPSEILQHLFGLPLKKRKNSVINLIPFILALVVTWYSFSQVLEHGLINTGQGILMQHNYFFQFAFLLIVLSSFVLVAAIGTYLWIRRE